MDLLSVDTQQNCTRSSLYNPSSNGLTERAVQTFKQGIKQTQGATIIPANCPDFGRFSPVCPAIPLLYAIVPLSPGARLALACGAHMRYTVSVEIFVVYFVGA